MQLNATQEQALRAICDTFIPSLDREGKYWRHAASDVPIVEAVLSSVRRNPPAAQAEFKQLLDLLCSNALGATWLGPLKPVAELTLEQREQLLNSWQHSAVPSLRKAFATLKKLCCLHYYGSSHGQQPYPAWEAVGYRGERIGEVPVRHTGSLTSERAVPTHVDAVVIGSGAGGGVVAAELVKQGLEVLILEKGAYVTEADMTRRETEMYGRLYERGAALSTQDGAVSILAGSCVGGGTTVNWSASFETPDWILEEWATEHDNPHFLTKEYKELFGEIKARTDIGTQLSEHNPQNSALLRGAEALGYHRDVIARNVQPPADTADRGAYWQSQGYGGLGDSYGYKSGTMKTYLQDAVDGGAHLLPHTEADCILTKQGRTYAVAYTTTIPGQKPTQATVRCRKVYVCAGAIHSPAVLLRSGFTHDHIGRHLYLHPTNAVMGVYPDRMEGWYGPMMSAVSDEYTRLDGNFGYKLETPPLHPGFMALATPWQSGEQFKEAMLRTAHVGAFIVLTRDKHGGRVRLDSDGAPAVTYRLHKYDRAHLVHGMQQAARIHRAAGAESVQVLHTELGEIACDDPKWEFYLKRMSHLSWAAHRFQLYSAHQMGTCRMGGRTADHPFKPTGESREVQGVYIADASAFPQCSGVNPMLSIQALALWVARTTALA